MSATVDLCRVDIYLTSALGVAPNQIVLVVIILSVYVFVTQKAKETDLMFARPSIVGASAIFVGFRALRLDLRI